MRFPRGRSTAVSVCCLVAAACCLPAASAQAAYPAGEGTFSGGAQGWQTTEADCDPAAFCSAEGGYDGEAGNPPGSLAAKTTIALNLLTLFKSTVAVQSPDFTVAAGGAGSLHLDRQFAPGSLVDLSPQVTYTASLIDRTTGTTSALLTETIKAASPFTGKDAAATVKAGHVYAISLSAETSSTVAGTGLLAGSTNLRFDNVALTVGSEAGGGGSAAGGNGKGAAGANGAAGGIGDRQLLSLVQNGPPATAMLAAKGKRLLVKAHCPAQAGRACRISLQGLLRRHKPATATRTSKVGKGRAKQLVLKVKPKAKRKLAKRGRLLFKETVRAGKAKATVYKRLKLIRRR